MSAGNVDIVTWIVRHRLKGDTAAEAATVEVETATSAEAIDQVRLTLPEGHVMTSVTRY